MRPVFIRLIVLLTVVMVGCGEQNNQKNTSVTGERGSGKGSVTADKAKVQAKAGKVKQGSVLPGLDDGFCQSPININSQATEKGGKHKITLKFNDEVNKIENLGHTVQLDFKAGSTITADDTTFQFKQCHFHTPSEHLIDGVNFPMEMHIVNILPDSSPEATPQYLVISVLFKEGKENKFIADFLNDIPKDKHHTEVLKPGQVKMADLFGVIPKTIKGDYYYYRGSLTTSPFTESVRWYITKNIFEASKEQVQTIKKIEGHNARQVQATNERVFSAK